MRKYPCSNFFFCTSVLALGLCLVARTVIAQTADNRLPLPKAPEVLHPSAESKRIEISTYSLKSTLSRLDREAGLSTTNQQHEFIVGRVKALFPAVTTTNVEPHTGDINSHVVGVETSNRSRVPMQLDSNGCGALIDGNNLIVACPTESHQAIARMLETWQQFGLRQIIIKTTVYRGETKAMSDLSINWSHVEAISRVAETPKNDVVSADFKRGSQTSSSVIASHFSPKLNSPKADRLEPPSGVLGDIWTEASSVIERSTPVLYTLLTPAESQSLHAKLSKTSNVETVLSPTVAVFNGQTASVSDTVQRPFVTGIKPTKIGPEGKQLVEFQPNVRIYPEGTNMEMRPELTDGKSVRLSFHLSLCKIRKVETLNLPRFNGAGNFTVQMPEVASTEFRTRLDLPLDHALAVSTFDTDENGVQQSVVVVCQCSVRDMENTATP